MLDVLVCTLESRKRQLGELLAAFGPQLVDRPASVIVDSDNGEVTIGAKRNRLLRKATRKYVAFVDDDDMVDSKYVELILRAIASRPEPDCVGIVGAIVEYGAITWTFRHSITVGRWCKDKANRIYYRTPNHLNPIRRGLALSVGFPEKSFGEDRAFSDKVRPMLNTEKFIDRPIYFYKMGNK